MSTILVSPKKIAASTALGGNVDTDKVVPHIVTAQDRHIQPVLGTKLYRHILSLVESGAITDAANAKYKNLLDEYVVPALSHYSLVNFIPFHQLEIVNSGMNTVSNEGAFPASSSAQKEVLARTRDNAEFYIGRLSAHLCEEGSQLYPEYQTENGSEDIYPKKPAPFHGIYLGNTGPTTLKEKGLY